MPEKKHPALLPLLDLTLFKEEEGTFTDNTDRKRVFVHLVPAPWSRVVAMSLVYALAVTMAHQVWVACFGRPEWHLTDAASAKIASQMDKKVAP